MAWEQRGNGRYYYRKRRVGGRVISEYVGGNEFAALLARLDKHEHGEREQARKLDMRRRAEDATIDKQLSELERAIRAITRVALMAEGFHQHRGQWRRRRAENNRYALPK